MLKWSDPRSLKCNVWFVNSMKKGSEVFILKIRDSSSENSNIDDGNDNVAEEEFAVFRNVKFEVQYLVIQVERASHVW